MSSETLTVPLATQLDAFFGQYTAAESLARFGECATDARSGGQWGGPPLSVPTLGRDTLVLGRTTEADRLCTY